jgi:uncharacterized DUF497 family protein
LTITGLIWLEDIVQKNLQKHTVQQQEVREIFANRPRFWFVENGHRAGENVYAALGQTEAGRYLIVFFVHKKDSRALILSARDMTSTERRRYGKK